MSADSMVGETDIQKAEKKAQQTAARKADYSAGKKAASTDDSMVVQKAVNSVVQLAVQWVASKASMTVDWLDLRKGGKLVDHWVVCSVVPKAEKLVWLKAAELAD
jgi:hypothetical protein